MSEKEKLELLEEIMDVEEPLTLEMCLEDIEEWDSLATLGLAAKVRAMDGRNLTADIIKSFVTVKDVCDYL